jgi:SAM-dependent methyltransferase
LNYLNKYTKFIESIGSPLLNLNDNIDKHLIKIIQDKLKSGSILEISCGNASDSLYLKKLGYNVICTDLNPDYVENAKNIGIECILHDTRNKFPFKNNQFDLVYSRLGLHYFTENELKNILSELKRIGKSILITIKIVDDIQTGKIIFTPEKWKELISSYFDIDIFEIKEGELYDNKSKWIEIFAKKIK